MVAELLLDVREHEGVVAELAQLHDRVHQRLRPALAFVALLRPVRQQHTLRLHVSNNITHKFILEKNVYSNKTKGYIFLKRGLEKG